MMNLIATGIVCFTALLIMGMWTGERQKQRTHEEAMATQQRVFEREHRGRLN